jgi:predicted aspartyl protease
MIRGVVNDRNEAVVSLRVRGPYGVEATINTILDTGFSSALALPVNAVTESGLEQESGGIATFADGSVRTYHMYAAEIEWDGRWKPTLVSLFGSEALLGMRLLVGHILGIEVVAGGLVEIVSMS